MLRVFLLAMGASAATFVISVILHNLVSAALGVEEPVFFIIAVVVAPAAFVVSAIGAVVALARRLT